MFLPTTKEELIRLGWEKLDVILITGDSYIDSPFIGIALVGKALLNAGFKVGIISQPDVDSDVDVSRLGEPDLFWGITGGCIDSMVANYTPTLKKRKSDDMTPGNVNNRRPDRAVIVYTNLIKRYFKKTKPIVLGGVEASLRRISHYDYWSDKIRRSILFDAKADILVYGMAEKTIVQLAKILEEGNDWRNIRGLCYISHKPVQAYCELPPFEHVEKNPSDFSSMFHLFYTNNDPLTARGLFQKHGNRYLIQNPPMHYLSQAELDEIYELDFERDVHPLDKKRGEVKALDTIRFSIPIHRGCFGECRFCAISVHQGRRVRSRSISSIIEEAKLLTRLPDFKGYITDLGGPTANMYGMDCYRVHKDGCENKTCLNPEKCQHLALNHGKLIRLLRELRKIKEIKKIFLGSGIRHDLVMSDAKCGNTVLNELVKFHISGQLKVAPEHSVRKVIDVMGKPEIDVLITFKKRFEDAVYNSGNKYYLTYYLMAAHPGCTDKDMKELKFFCTQILHLSPEQVQIFTPTPSTYSTLMYYLGKNPFTGEKLFVEKNKLKKEHQKRIIVQK